MPYPVASGLGNVFSDLLGGETQRTDLGSKSRGGTDLTTSGAEVATICQLQCVQELRLESTYITLTSLGSNLGAVHRVSRKIVPDIQE
jgi:hypothetical protein